LLKKKGPDLKSEPRMGHSQRGTQSARAGEPKMRKKRKKRESREEKAKTQQEETEGEKGITAEATVNEWGLSPNRLGLRLSTSLGEGRSRESQKEIREDTIERGMRKRVLQSKTSRTSRPSWPYSERTHRQNDVSYAQNEQTRKADQGLGSKAVRKREGIQE